MSVTDIINGTAGANGAGAASGAKKKDQLGQEQFLELMIAQLRNQDPFKAMDPSQFLGQLAQFGTVTGIQEMQTAFATLSESMRSSQVLEGATMVGRDVLVASEDLALGATGAIEGAIDVPTGASSVQVSVLDDAGQLVRRMTIPANAGLTEFAWDGLDDGGERAASGAYTIEAIANVGGRATSLETLLESRVGSVTIDAQRGLQLNTTTLGTRALNEVRRVM